MDIGFCLQICLLVAKLSALQGAMCGNGRETGENDVASKDDHIDTANGLGILVDSRDNEFTVPCCGLVESWKIYAGGNTGTVQLQMWRPGSGNTFTLVGQNAFTISAGDTNQMHTYNVPSNEQISVKSGDIIGWYSAGAPIIMYEPDNGFDEVWQSTAVGPQTVGSSFDWGTGTQIDYRDYGIQALLGPGNSPSFTNIDASISFPDTTPIGTVLYTIAYTDPDPTDNLVVTMTTSTSSFSFDVTSNNVTNTQAFSSGSTTLTFRVTDDCGNTDTNSLTISSTNSPPVIHNLPAYNEISEDQTQQMLLHTINVTDGSLADTVTCSISNVSPSSSDFSVSSSGNGIYIKNSPTLNYDTARQYILTVACTDGKDTTTGTFTLYITRNKPPAITNLWATLSVSSSSTMSGTVIYTVTSTDPENDTLTYTMTCDPTPCPFTISNTGNVSTTSNLNSHTVPGYDVYVYVSDGKNLVGPRTLTVVIDGINYTPVITNLPLTGTIAVQENTALATSLFQVFLTDINPGDTHSYTAIITPSTGTNLFSIDSSTGVVTTSSTQNINLEALSANTYSLSITASDGTSSDTETLSIAVTNQNEAPEFNKETYVLTVNEGSAGSLVGDPGFGVNDPDTNANKFYSIDCPDFDINAATGLVSFTTDYDSDIAGTASMLTCTVTVSDGELTDNASLVVTINNINDNTPTFHQSLYTMYSQTYHSIGAVVGSIAATDGDLGTFGSISYALDQTSLDNEYFGLMSNGSVYIRNSLQSFTNGTTLIFSASVQDTGGLQDSATIRVIVPEYTTPEPATTTDRYITFIEDSRNIAWLVVVGIILLTMLPLVLLLLYRYGKFPSTHNCCKMKVSRWPKHGNRWGIQKSEDVSALESLDQQMSPESSLRTHSADSSVSKEMWEPWNNQDDYTQGHKSEAKIPQLFQF